jgi:astacin
LATNKKIQMLFTSGSNWWETRNFAWYEFFAKTSGLIKVYIGLGRGCLFNETIIHELMHSLGFWHEHSRSDREDHINIKWENILPGMDSQFEVVSAAIQDTMEEPYDYQ